MHIRTAPFCFRAITIGDAYVLRDSWMMPAARRSLRWHLTSSMSPGAMRRERSRKGRVSLSLIWWVTYLAKPTSHSSVENTLLRSANFKSNLFSQAAGIGASPKLNNSGLRGPFDSGILCATVTVSVGNTWAITVPTGIERSLLVSLWIRTLRLFTSTADKGITTGETNSPKEVDLHWMLQWEKYISSRVYQMWLCIRHTALLVKGLWKFLGLPISLCLQVALLQECVHLEVKDLGLSEVSANGHCFFH